MYPLISFNSITLNVRTIKLIYVVIAIVNSARRCIHNILIFYCYIQPFFVICYKIALSLSHSLCVYFRMGYFTAIFPFSIDFSYFCSFESLSLGYCNRILPCYALLCTVNLILCTHHLW